MIDDIKVENLRKNKGNKEINQLPNPDPSPKLTVRDYGNKFYNLVNDFNKVYTNKINQIRNFSSVYSDQIATFKQAIKNLETVIDEIRSFATSPELQTAIRNLNKSLGITVDKLFEHNLIVSLNFIDDYLDLILDDKTITDTEIYTLFKKQYPRLKENLMNDKLYHNKISYVERALKNFEQKKYVESMFLMQALLENVTIYEWYKIPRKPEFERIKKVLNIELSDKDMYNIEVVYRDSIIKLIDKYHEINNELQDPDLINRNRLMHGIYDIESIDKLECIKVLYLIESLSTIELIQKEHAIEQ